MIKTLTNLFKQDKEKFVVPKGVQDVIPIKAIYDDGIFQVGKDKFSKSFKFTDINYAVAMLPQMTGRQRYSVFVQTMTEETVCSLMTENPAYAFSQFPTLALQILPQCGIARRAEAGSRNIDVGSENRL